MHLPRKKADPLQDVPADAEVEPADVEERVEQDPDAERNRTDPEQADTLDHPAQMPESPDRVD